MKAWLYFFRGNWASLFAALVLLSPGRAFGINLLVYNNNDSGAGSLRQAILNNDLLGGGNTIVFSNVVTGTITLTTGELLVSSNLTILGPGANLLAVSGNYSSRVFLIENHSVVSISGLTICSGNVPDSQGGGIDIVLSTLTISNCTLSGNVAAQGGAIYNSSSATLTVIASTLSGNAAGYGGAIYNDGSFFPGNATLTISNSTFAVNLATNLGGGIESDGTGAFATLTVIGSTFSGNSANAGGGINNEKNSIFHIGNTIMSTGASGSNIRNSPLNPTMPSLGYNLLSDGGGFSPALGDQFNTDPMLGPLQDNGGPVRTMMPLPGSPALDQGKSFGTVTDQRGLPRLSDNPGIPNAVGGDGSDIGAVEVSPEFKTSVVGAGTVLKNPDQRFYAYGSAPTVVLSAYPATGWAFSSWSGDASGNNNPLTLGLTMTGDKLVTATFTNVNGTCVAAPPGLVGWWPGAGTARDVIGNNNGTLQSGVAFAPGKVGTAFSFNGAAGGVNLGNVPDFDFTPDSSFSISAWFNTSGTTGGGNDNQIIISLNYNCGITLQNLGLENGGPSANKVFFEVRDAGGLDGLVLSPFAVTTGQFHHVVGVREVNGNTKTLLLYLDGVLVATNADSSTGQLSQNTADWIGRRNTCGTDNVFNGLIDEVAIFNRALSTNEIQALFNAGSSGMCLAPVYFTAVNKSGTNVNLFWLSQQGMSYRAQFRTNLGLASPWTDISGDVIAPGVTAGKTDNPPATAPQRFYRVELMQ